MSVGDDAAQRLARLHQILSDGNMRRPAPAADAVAEHLSALRPDRIQRLTREIEARRGSEIDEIDQVAMRLVLDEYVSALAHLRMIAGDSATHVGRVPAALKDVRRYLEREQEIEAKRSASAAPSA